MGASSVTPQASGRIQRWALTMSMYEYSLIFKRIAEHSNADTMSCLHLLEKIHEVPKPAEVVLVMKKLEAITTKHIKAWSRINPNISPRICMYGLAHETDDVKGAIPLETTAIKSYAMPLFLVFCSV